MTAAVPALSMARQSTEQVTPSFQREVAQLIFDALPDFYEMIPLDHVGILDMIATETVTEATECFAPLIARIDGMLAGVVCGFPLAELGARQQQSLLHIMRRLDRPEQKVFRTAARAAVSISPITPVEGLYVARIAVAPRFRGQGVGRAVLEAFRGRSRTATVSLHVDAGNNAAIAFYRRIGFEIIGQGDFRKIAMRMGGCCAP